MRVLWAVLIAVAIVAAFFASVHFCHSYMVEEFDDKDVPQMFRLGRRQTPTEEEMGDDYDHMVDPDEVQPSLEQEEYSMNTWEGGIATALYEQRPDIFSKINEWYVSDVAYDLEGLEKELALDAADYGTDLQAR